MFLARHGSAQMPDRKGRVWNYSPAELTEAGQAQAHALGQSLAEVKLDAVYASDLLRAKQTAEAIADATGAGMVVDPRLREIDIGEHEGASLDALSRDHPEFVPWLAIAFGGRFPRSDFRVPASLRFPGGESVEEMLARSLPAFLEITERHRGETAVIVAHQWLVQALLCHVTGTPIESYDRFAVPQASLTLVEAGDEGRGVLHVLNGTRRLGEAAGGRLAVGSDERRLANDPDRADTCRVFVIRHGEAMRVQAGAPVYSHRPVPLTPVGEAQADGLAQALRPIAIDAVYTSDLLRARQTAERIAAPHGLAPIVEPALREIALGEFEGMTRERVHAEHPRFVPWLEVSFVGRFPSDGFHHPADLAFPAGESVAGIYPRVREAFERIVARHLGGTVVIAAHGWVIQPLLCHVIDCEVANYFRFPLGYASTTMVEVDADARGVLEAFNGGAPLAEVAGGRLGGSAFARTGDREEALG